MKAKASHSIWSIVLGSLLLLSQFLSAETVGPDLLPPYKSRLWQFGEDVNRNTIRSMAQSADGFLWIGTQGGLARFDGDDFEFVTVGTGEISGSQQINALCVDATGALWAGTAHGLYRWKNGKWTDFVFPPEVDDTVLTLRPGHDGDMWIGTRLGLVRFKDEKVTLVGKVSATSILEKNTAVHSIRSMEENAQKELWVSASDSLILLRNGVAVTNLGFGNFKPDFIRATCCRADGSIWIGCNAGLIRYQDGKYTQFTKTNGLPDNSVTAVHEDRQGNLWVGTFGGLGRFVNEKIVVEQKSEAESHDLVYCFFEDREGSLWVGAKDGLYQLTAQQFTTLTTLQGLAHNNVTSVYEDRDGALWVGTWGGGLHRWRDGRMRIFSVANTPALRNELVLALHGARDGSFWFGEDYDGGLYHMKDGEFQRYGKEQNLWRSAIRAVLEDRAGRLLVGHSSSGLGILEHGKIRFMGSKQGMPNQNIRCLLETADGVIWIGTEGGLCRWTGREVQTFGKKNGLSDQMILSLYEDKEADLWIGTAKGLSRLKQGRISTYGAEKGLTDESILEIVEDDLKDLWLATRRGIFRVSKKNIDAFDEGKAKGITSTLFGKADGMNSQVCVGVAKPSAIKSRDGRLWFATTKGLAVTDPKLSIPRNNQAPAVVIRKVIADKEVMFANTGLQGSAGSGRGADSAVVIRPGNGSLEFQYTALSYTTPEKNQFKYKLEGLDADWIDVGTRHTAFYNNLAPGNYIFRVQACNSDGVWNEQGANVAFVLQPHYWQTMWFKFLAGFSSFSLVAGAVRYFTRKKLQRKLERLEQQNAVEKERARIAQDMHDDLGAGLTGVLLLAERTKASASKDDAARTADEIADSVRDLAQNLDALVWAENPRHDTQARLFSYVTDYAVKFLSKSSVRCRLDVPVELPESPASSEMRHNVYLVVKEALNNVVKYSGATEVWLKLSFEESKAFLVIEDNGKGFARKETRAFGNGLANMARRMEEVGGRFDLDSEPGRGTRIRLEIPIRRK